QHEQVDARAQHGRAVAAQRGVSADLDHDLGPYLEQLLDGPTEQRRACAARLIQIRDDRPASLHVVRRLQLANHAPGDRPEADQADAHAGFSLSARVMWPSAARFVREYSPDQNMSLAVALRNIDKRFNGAVALDDATLEVERGELHALLGENGAGKTSLMNVLVGLYRPEAGQIEVHGLRAELSSPQDARRLGIGMLHQEQRLVGRFTAAENVALGHRTPRWLLLKASL